MTQEDKELLLKDLSARLAYGVKCVEIDPINESIIYTLVSVYKDNVQLETDNGGIMACAVDAIKPYLRPRSSIASLISAKEWSSLCGIELIDWYNANHIDYRGLIEKGLAIEVTEDNNPYK